MIFKEYYLQEFRNDLNAFMMSIPEKSRHHDSNLSEFTIQYECLTKDNPYFDVVPMKNRKDFAISLFFTILIDEVFYTYFYDRYHEFQKLTRYPKFIGNCPGSCQYHFHPREIFNAINYSRDGINLRQRSSIAIDHSFILATEIMRVEVFEFFSHHLDTVDPKHFWNLCLKELP